MRQASLRHLPAFRRSNPPDTGGARPSTHRASLISIKGCWKTFRAHSSIQLVPFPFSFITPHAFLSPGSMDPFEHGLMNTNVTHAEGSEVSGSAKHAIQIHAVRHWWSMWRPVEGYWTLRAEKDSSNSACGLWISIFCCSDGCFAITVQLVYV